MAAVVNMDTQAGLVKASAGWAEFQGRLPWRSRARYYLALSRRQIPSARFGSAVYVPRWALEALATGDLDALNGSGRKA